MEKSRSADPGDVASGDAVVKAFYEAVSFLPGRQPDYDRLRTLFHPEARVIPPEGELGPLLEVYGVEAFVSRSREHVVISGLERGGFSQTEIARRSHAFGSILHVFSTYAAQPSATGEEAIQHGINSIQLLNEGGRWWVVTLHWEVERPGNPLPSRFLS